jgi:uncharacterized membrane protein YidH (DUF202 family)
VATADDELTPGLAGERTELAWSRTALSMAVVAAAVLQRVWEGLGTVTARVAVLGILAASAIAWLGALWWAQTAGRASLEGRAVADPRVLRRVTVATVLVAATALLLAVVPAS